MNYDEGCSELEYYLILIKFQEYDNKSKANFFTGGNMHKIVLLHRQTSGTLGKHDIFIFMN